MKIRITQRKLFAELMHGDLAGATSEFDAEVIDDDGRIVGNARFDFHGKVGNPEQREISLPARDGDYVCEAELAPQLWAFGLYGPPCVNLEHDDDRL